MPKEKNTIRLSEQTPLKWPDGQERTLIDRRVPRNGWKKTFKQYADRLVQQLKKLGVEDATVCFNPSPSDRIDPGVAVYFSTPQKQDFSWQVALGIDSPMPTIEQIDDAFKAKAKKHHPDVAQQTGGDPKFYYQFDQHRQNAVAWIRGTARKEYVIAVDRCTEPRWNLEAIRRILIAVSTMDEYGNPGTLERTFRGFKVALPQHASSSEVKPDVFETVSAR